MIRIRMKRQEAYLLCDAAREHQIQKWNRKPEEWPVPELKKLAVLAEEFGEVAMAVNDHDTENLKEELAQVMAVACQWLEAEF